MDDLVRRLTALLQQKKTMLALAESCTGGLLSAFITALPGSSKVFDRGFVTYSNDAKMTLLNVSHEVLNKYGSVSAEVAKAMARGALENSRASLAISITGIAGPGGGNADKPVGLVYIGYAINNDTGAEAHHFKGSRADIRAQAVEAALQLAIVQAQNIALAEEIYSG